MVKTKEELNIDYELKKEEYLKNKKNNKRNNNIKKELFIDIKYSHQLFFLSKEVDKIKQYFIKLNKVVINNNNNNNDHFNQDGYNYDKLAQQISVLTNNSKHYNSIRCMINTDNALMIIIALLFKGFSWTNEILNDFSIDYKMYVVNTIATLKKLDLLISDDGVSLHPILFDAIKQSKNSHFRKSLHQAKIYFITPLFIRFCETLTDLFEYKLKNSSNFRHSLSQIIKHSDIFNNKMNKILYDEETLSYRNHQSEEGVPYITPTLRTKYFQKLLLEVNNNKNKDIVLTNTNKSIILSKDQIDIINFKKTYRPTTEYNSKKLTEEEYNNIILKRMEYDNEINECDIIKGDSKITNQIPRDINGKEIKSMFLSKKEAAKWIEPIKTENEKVLDFLSSLEVVEDE